MRVIRGLRTVNNGEIVQFNRKDLFNNSWIFSNNSEYKISLEVLRPEKHNPDYQIICYYFWDIKLNAKIEVTLYRNIKTNIWGSEVYYFKNREALQHYKSRNYVNFVELPGKYYTIIKWIHPCFIEIFGN